MDVLDRQHLEIKRRHKNLRTAIVEGLGMDQIVACAKDLIDVTIGHFKSEEGAMEENKFQGLSAHKLLHAEMLESVKKIWSDLERRKISNAMELMKFFDERLVFHLEQEDIMFERELRTRM